LENCEDVAASRNEVDRLAAGQIASRHASGGIERYGSGSIDMSRLFLRRTHQIDGEDGEEPRGSESHHKKYSTGSYVLLHDMEMERQLGKSGYYS